MATCSGKANRQSNSTYCGRDASDFSGQTPGVTLLTLGEPEFLGTSCEAPPRRWTCDAIAFACVSALAVDAARLKDEWESDHAFGFACLRRMLPVFQSNLDHARLQSLDLYG